MYSDAKKSAEIGLTITVSKGWGQENEMCNAKSEDEMPESSQEYVEEETTPPQRESPEAKVQESETQSDILPRRMSKCAESRPDTQFAYVTLENAF